MTNVGGETYTESLKRDNARHSSTLQRYVGFRFRHSLTITCEAIRHLTMFTPRYIKHSRCSCATPRNICATSMICSASPRAKN